MLDVLAFEWRHERGGRPTPACLGVDSADRDVRALAALLSDDGGLGHDFLIDDVRRTADRLEAASRDGVAAHWTREYWEVRFDGRRAEIVYLDSVEGEVGMPALLAALRAWAEFCAGGPGAGVSRAVRF